MNNDNAVKKMFEAFEKSYTLWPNPFLSPEVPERKILLEFMQNCSTLENDLVEHISSSTDCQRAIEILNIDKNQDLKDVLGLNEEVGEDSSIQQILDNFGENEPQNKTLFEVKTNIVSFPEKKRGMLFTTTHTFSIFKDNKIKTGYSFLPPKILLLNNGEKTPWGDTVFRAAFVTPEGLFDSVEGQDFITKNGWTVHLWLSYPISIKQLDQKIAEIQKINEICDFVKNFETDENTQLSVFGLEQKRIMKIASYIPIGADAEMAKYEWMQNCFENTNQNKIIELGKEEYKQAAATDEASRFLVRYDSGEEKLISATIEDPVCLSSETKENESLPSWAIPKELLISDGTIFVLKDFRNGKIIGSGTIKNNIASLKDLDSKSIEIPIENADDMMLEVITNE